MEKVKVIYPGQDVCILGLGVTGRSAAKYCLQRGAKVRISDTRDTDRFLKEEGEFVEKYNLDWEAGGHSLEFLDKSDLLLPSPGVNLGRGVIAELLAKGKAVAGELAVVAEELQVPVVAVTGTNGKTTVTTLIGEVLTKVGKRVFVGGNIGTPLYEYCLAAEGYDVIVVEVSSFQLECSGSFAPDVAVLLNITPDHLDRHPSMEEYIAAKGNLFCNMQRGSLAVINADDAGASQVVVPEAVKRATFGAEKNCSLQICDGDFVIADDVAGPRRFTHSVPGLEGFLNYNYAAAYLALKKLGLEDALIRKGFVEFKALPHRLEFVDILQGVSFVNDSKATNTGAVIGALKRYEGGVVLIAGGRDKGEDYALLRDSVREKVQTLVLIGEASDKIEASLGDIVACIRAKSIVEAVRVAFERAAFEDTVLLSPACASFDMFASYGDRGNQFRKAVEALVCDHKVKEAS